jgi:hypothetical protein
LRRGQGVGSALHAATRQDDVKATLRQGFWAW